MTNAFVVTDHGRRARARPRLFTRGCTAVIPPHRRAARAGESRSAVGPRRVSRGPGRRHAELHLHARSHRRGVEVPRTASDAVSLDSSAISSNRSRRISSAPTRRRTACRGRHGSIPSTPARCGDASRPRRPIRTSSHPAPFRGCCLKRPAPHSGPTGGSRLAATTFIQRLNTSGGIAPATGCSQPSEIGALALVPYTTDYFFYQARRRN